MFLVYLFRHCQSSHLLSLLFSYLHTTINLLILQAGSQRISESRPVSVIAFLHLPYLIFQHTLDFVAHGFLDLYLTCTCTVHAGKLSYSIFMHYKSACISTSAPFTSCFIYNYKYPIDSLHASHMFSKVSFQNNPQEIPGKH